MTSQSGKTVKEELPTAVPVDHWDTDPADLEGMTLDELNEVAVSLAATYRVDAPSVFDTVESATGWLTQNHKGS